MQENASRLGSFQLRLLRNGKEIALLAQNPSAAIGCSCDAPRNFEEGKMKHSLAMLSVFFASTILAAQTPTVTSGPLTRHYREGETLAYRMNATNDDLRYTADVSCVTGRDAAGGYVEECRWTALTRNGQPVVLTPETAQFRERVSLDPGEMPSPPAPAKADPRLEGPILDFFTFYVDLWLANRVGTLVHPGDRFYMPMPQVGSWGDGTHVLIGKSQVDFDLNLHALDPARQEAELVVRHVPPAHPNLNLPAAWMQAPVAESPNNWVEVTRLQDGRYEAGAGKETFDDSITVSTQDGKILLATMDNPVVTSSRVCEDEALTKCGDARPHTIRRHIEMVLER